MPDYYRLGYQLSAQLLNYVEYERGAKGGAGEATGPQRLPDELAARVSRARRTAGDLAAEVDAMVKWLERRDLAKRWERHTLKELQPEERRLVEFLRRTVKPCLQLVIAAALRLERDAAGAEEAAAEVRTDADDEKALSYRALYNLACYEAGADCLQHARRYLEQALRRAPAGRKEELAKWTDEDPALRRLHTDDKTTELIERNQPSQPIAEELNVDDLVELLALVLEGSGFTLRQAQKKTGRTPARIKRILLELEEREALEKRGQHYFPRFQPGMQREEKS